MARTIAATEFKAKCLAILDEVAETRSPVVVTKRGKPVALVVPPEDPPSLLGSAEQLCSDDELVHFSAWEGWGEDEMGA
ncbi:MAG TPA: type II toxin-antitoxin system Phd/YefM family antitoxin [Gaiellaceae bacterium]|nr:type II toxin-antitoxin system Phd/YefM family antitoxin [Gaiellaceae bacterium]